MKNLIMTILILSNFVSFSQAKLPAAPSEAQHPGSKSYSYLMKSELLKCNKRDVFIFVPQSKTGNEFFPVVIYGHGQALKIEHYQSTLEHLAKKGIIALFPTYDTGFFDQDWKRMARDYVAISECAINKISKDYNVSVNRDLIIYSGHSKGAYVAGVAAGLSFRENLQLKPKGVMLFQPAGLDVEANTSVDKEVLYNVVYSEKDKIVSKKISEEIFQQVPASKKQFLLVKSYPELEAGHFWPLTKSSAFGGTSENAFHYYSSWKWLVSLANDLKIGGLGSDDYLFGSKALDKGVSGLSDEIIRSW